MKVILQNVTKGESGQNLPQTSLSYESGAINLAAVETATRPTVLALLATGRMVPDAGTLAFAHDDLPAAELPSGPEAPATPDSAAPDSAATAPAATTTAAIPSGPATTAELAVLRTITALVDAPDVSEPVADLRLSSVVQEELMFAGRPSNRRAALDLLDEFGAGDYAKWELKNVPVAVRLRVLTELAASRPDVEALVLAAPDRHGGDPREWWAIAVDLAHRNYAVLVIANQASIDDLREASEAFDAERQRALRAAAIAAAAATTTTAAAAATTTTATTADDAAQHPAAPPRATTAATTKDSA